MSSDKPCEAFLDDITRNDQPSPDLVRHLEQCARCREIRSSVETLRELPSAFPDALVRHFEGKALEGLKTGIGADVSPAGPSFGPSWPVVIAGAVLVGGVLGWLTFFPPPGRSGNPPVSPGPGGSAAVASAAVLVPEAGRPASPTAKPASGASGPEAILSSENEDAKP